MWTYRAQLVRLVDADSVRLLCDTGFGQRYEVELRLIGCYMPEARQPGGPEMRQVAQAWVDEWTGGLGQLLTWPLLVETSQSKVIEPSQQRTFTRWLGALYRYDGRRPIGEPLNERLTRVLERDHPEWGRGIGGAA